MIHQAPRPFVQFVIEHRPLTKESYAWGPLPLWVLPVARESRPRFDLPCTCDPILSIWPTSQNQLSAVSGVRIRPDASGWVICPCYGRFIE